jgi:hypothetical protein
VRRGLVDMGVLGKKEAVAAKFIADIPHAYVVYDSHRTPSLAIIHSYLRDKGCISTGRWGAWEYGSMEDAIWQGADAAKVS